MNNGYNIGFDDDLSRTKVYLVPQCNYMGHFKQVGYIDHDDSTFHCIESKLMTLEVMEAIVNHWKVYNHNL
jgi:hypothetical protein